MVVRHYIMPRLFVGRHQGNNNCPFWGVERLFMLLGEISEDAKYMIDIELNSTYTLLGYFQVEGRRQTYRDISQSGFRPCDCCLIVYTILKIQSDSVAFSSYLKLVDLILTIPQFLQVAVKFALVRRALLSPRDSLVHTRWPANEELDLFAFLGLR